MKTSKEILEELRDVAAVMSASDQEEEADTVALHARYEEYRAELRKRFRALEDQYAKAREVEIRRPW